MIRNPIDIATRVSPDLSSLIETVIGQLDAGEPVTLAGIRTFIQNDLSTDIDEIEHMHHFDVDESISDELDELIEQFGESAAAMDFIAAFASEPLSRVIEEVLDDENRDNSPSLDDIREALLKGLGSSLVGEGVLEDDEEYMLMPEIDELIEQFGGDALAEDFLRYE